MAKEKLSIRQQGKGYKSLLALTAVLTILMILTIPVCSFMPWSTLIMAVMTAVVCAVRERKVRR